MQGSNSNTVNITQTNIDQNIASILETIQKLYVNIQELPEDLREQAEVNLDDLKAEIESPDRRNSKRIRTYLKALAGVAGVAATFMVNSADFVNNITDIGEKMGIQIEYPQLVQQNLPSLPKQP